MKQQIPWVRVLVEGAVIVGSILLALAIDTWSADRQDRQQEDRYLIRLASDLRGDLSNWSGELGWLAQKQAGLDQALSWIRAPDEAPQAVDELLDDLTQGSRLAFGHGIRAQRATFDELISTGALRLLRPDVRAALQNYHTAVAGQRARLTSRETEYQSRVYELVPRDPEFMVRDDLSSSARLQIARRVLEMDLETLIVAERNRGRLRQEVVGFLLDNAEAVLDLVDKDTVR